jgi:CheY-like chemotaxis protein
LRYRSATSTSIVVTPALTQPLHAHMNLPDTSRLKDLRVLVVEDEYLVAKSLESMLRALGCNVVGTASTVEAACSLIKNRTVDAALLDINLSPGTCEPIARALRYREIPFVFLTGYSNLNMLPDDLRGYRIVTKPADAATIARVLQETVRGNGN